MSKEIIDELVVTLGLDSKSFKSNIDTVKKQFDEFAKHADGIAAKVEKTLQANGIQPRVKKPVVETEKPSKKQAAEKEGDRKGKTQKLNEKDLKQENKEELEREEKTQKLKEKGRKQEAKYFKASHQEHKESGKDYGALKDNVVRMFAAFTAGKGAIGFLRDMVSNDAGIARMAKNLDMSAAELSAWGLAVEQAGGSAEGLQGTFKGLSQHLTELKLTGTSSILPLLNKLNITLTDGAHNALPFVDQLKNIRKGLLSVAGGATRADKVNMGLMLGVDEGTLNFLLQEDEAFEKGLETQRKRAAVSEKSAESMRLLQGRWINFKQTIEATTKSVVAGETPALMGLMAKLEQVGTWAETHKDTVKTALTGGGAVLAIGAVSGPLKFIFGMLKRINPLTALFTATLSYGLTQWQKWSSGGKSALSGVFDGIKKIGGAFGKIDTSGFMSSVEKVASAIGNTFKALATGNADDIKKQFSTLGENIHSAFTSGTNLAKTAWDTLIKALDESGGSDWLAGRFKLLNENFDNIGTKAKNFAADTLDVWSSLGGALGALATGSKEDIEKQFGALGSSVKNAFESATTLSKGVWDEFTRSLKTSGLEDWLNGRMEIFSKFMDEYLGPVKAMIDAAKGAPERFAKEFPETTKFLGAAKEKITDYVTDPEHQKKAGYALKETGKAFLDIITGGSEKHGLDPDVIKAQIQQESGFNPNARNASGAAGIAQLMPATAKSYGVNPMNPEEAINKAMLPMMESLLKQFGGSYEKALAAYNWGSGNLEKDIAKHGEDWRDFLPKETQNYTKSIMQNAGYARQERGTPGAPQAAPSQSTTTISVGHIDVKTQATDARGIARDLRGAMVATAESGPT